MVNSHRNKKEGWPGLVQRAQTSTAGGGARGQGKVTHTRTHTCTHMHILARNTCEYCKIRNVSAPLNLA